MQIWNIYKRIRDSILSYICIPERETEIEAIMSGNEVHITMTPVDTLCFKVTTGSGVGFFVEASPGLGGSGTNASPLAHFLGSLGGCTSIKTTLGLEKRGKPCASLSVDIRAKQREEPPQIFESIHLSFTLKGDLDDHMVHETITEVITMSCPVAVMVGKAVPITWEYRIVRD